jgi:hypothetical protein
MHTITTHKTQTQKKTTYKINDSKEITNQDDEDKNTIDTRNRKSLD